MTMKAVPEPLPAGHRLVRLPGHHLAPGLPVRLVRLPGHRLAPGLPVQLVRAACPDAALCPEGAASHPDGAPSPRSNMCSTLSKCHKAAV